MENSNFARIACLLMHEGTRRVQEAVLRHLPERTTLAQALSNKQSELYDLMRRQRVMSKAQYETLYPFTGDTSRIDISLWLILARNITTKTSRKGVNWLKSPAKHETLWAHDLIRIREIRNFLFHVSAPELVGERFFEIKTELFAVLRRLGTPDDVINGHMTRDLDPQQTEICALQIREQYMEEQNSLLHAAAQHKRQTRILIVVLSTLAVFVLTAFSIPLAWYLQQQVPCSKYVRQITSRSGVLYFLPRSGWKASPPKYPSKMENLTKPVHMAAVFHTAMMSERCQVTEDCCQMVKDIQKMHMNGEYFDIAYNYLIGDDGIVYEGRGSQYQGAACWSRSSEIISIAMLGHFACQKPSAQAMAALFVFLEYLVDKDPSTEARTPVLTENYTLYGHCQINIQTAKHNTSFPDSPGAGVMQEIQYWKKHWRPDNITHCTVVNDCIMSSVCCKPNCTTWIGRA